MQPVILEVRANEFADATPNPNVPLGADAMVADAIASAAAGASIYHWHGRAADGSDHPDDAALHAEVIDGVRANADMLLHATLGFTSTQGDAASRMRTIDALAGRGRTPDMVPVDVGAWIADPWDEGHRRFASDDQVLLNKTGYLIDLLTEIGNRQLPIQAVVWSPGAVRTLLRLREQGIVTVPVYWQLGFTGDAMPGAMPATPRQLDAFLEMIPAGEPWNLHVRNGDGLALASHAILRGGHVAVGLGDDPYERLSLPSNADLIRRLATFAETIGRPVATGADTRRLLGIPALR